MIEAAPSPVTRCNPRGWLVGLGSLCMATRFRKVDIALKRVVTGRASMPGWV